MENTDLRSVLQKGSSVSSFYDAQTEELKKQASQKKTTKVEFDEKNYLSTKLTKEDKSLSKKLHCRILDAFDLDDETCFVNDKKTGEKRPIPFKEIWSHTIKMKDGKFKTFTCLNKTKGIDHLGLGHKCPFCELEEMLLEEAHNEKDRAISLETFKKAKSYSARRQYIVRAIDRNMEEDGPKFWRFDSSSNQQGTYDKLKALYEDRIEGGSIYNTYCGKDLKINIQGKIDNNVLKSSIASINDDEKRTPLSNDENQIMEWIQDSKKWYQVFPPKPYEYLDIAKFGDTPMYTKVKAKDGSEVGLFTSKNEFDAIKNNGGDPYYDLDEEEWKDARMLDGGRTDEPDPLEDGFTDMEALLNDTGTNNPVEDEHEIGLPF